MANRRILLIEDDYDVAEMLLMYFGANGYDVAHADTGADGVEMAQTTFPHLILLDVMLPDMDGYDTCYELRHKSLTKYIPIIFLTQRDERAAKVRGLELGADDYVTKPFDVEELRLRVQASIRRATRENLHEDRTGLPMGPLIDEELQKRSGSDYRALRFMIEGYNTYADIYSFLAASDVLYHAGKIILSGVTEHGTVDDFVGIVENDFVVLTHAKDVKALENHIKEQFDERVKAFYSFADAARGGILLNAGTDDETLVPMMHFQTALQVYS